LVDLKRRQTDFVFKATIVITILLLGLFPVMTFAQNDSISSAPYKPWKFDGTFVFSINESSFTNWVAGGSNQIDFNSILKPNLVFDNKKWSWSVSLDIRRGLQKISSDKAHKSDDVLRMESKLGRRISEKWKFSGLYTFNS
jgi:hypothetical protein